VLDETLLLDDLEPEVILVGDLAIDSCEPAVAVLRATDLSGLERHGDAPHVLASEYLTARLNLIAGAGSCDVADEAVERADKLLHSMHFTGIGPGTSAPGLLGRAVELTKTLAEFNRRTLCEEQPGPPVELPTIGVLIPIYWGIRRTGRGKHRSNGEGGA
jgi:hypothetical protein